MRKILILLIIVIAVAAAMSILWLVGGRQLALFVDRFSTGEPSSTPVRSLIYEGSGTRGILLINDLRLNLDPADPKQSAPNIGTTKEGGLALSFGGKVFTFGPIRTSPETAEETLATAPEPGDKARIVIQHGVLNWLELTAQQGATWKRHVYYELFWKKSFGGELRMQWRYEQPFHSGSGWGGPFLTRPGSTGLIRIDIQP